MADNAIGQITIAMRVVESAAVPAPSETCCGFRVYSEGPLILFVTHPSVTDDVRAAIHTICCADE